MRSPVYWHRLIYLNTYGRSHPSFLKRYELVAGLIRPGASVLDVCCGDADLYTLYLQKRGVKYTGIDISFSMAPRRVRPLLLKGNVRTMELPAADYVVMVEALYHFHPETEKILERMRKAAREKLIVIEQIQSRISRLPVWLNRLLSNPGDGSGSFRFDRAALERVIDRVDPQAERRLVCKGYDLMVVMAGLARK